jgi:hypothetical protein
MHDPDQALSGGGGTVGQARRRVRREQIGQLGVGDLPSVELLRIAARIVGDRRVQVADRSRVKADHRRHQ